MIFADSCESPDHPLSILPVRVIELIGSYKNEFEICEKRIHEVFIQIWETSGLMLSFFELSFGDHFEDLRLQNGVDEDLAQGMQYVGMTVVYRALSRLLNVFTTISDDILDENVEDDLELGIYDFSIIYPTPIDAFNDVIALDGPYTTLEALRERLDYLSDLVF